MSGAEGVADTYKTTGRSTTTPVADKQRKELLVDSDVLEIQINDTPTANDDCVQVKCDCMQHRHNAPCRIRLRKPGSGDITAVLTNPDGRLRFAGAGDTTTTVVVPGSGAWVSFEISGEKGSQAIDDAVIEAHRDSADGEVLARKPVTVFWFDQAKMDLKVGSAYAIGRDMYQPQDREGITHSAQARLQPDGLDYSASPLSVLKVGIVQNDMTNGFSGETVWGNPTIEWYLDVPPGTKTSVPAQYHEVWNTVGINNDTDPYSTPLYDQPGTPEDPNHWEHSTMPPINCPGGGPTLSADGPATPTDDARTQTATDTDGDEVGTVTYPVTRYRVSGKFMVWTVIFNTKTKEVCPLRQRGWSVDATSSATTPQLIKIDAHDAPVTLKPVLDRIANDVVNDPANRFKGPIGSKKITFSR
ncbi:hypothetical protein [Paraburkholderia sp. J67]|uniref:hypothetical protein n=1 Tax=Paraburkholderia sp. J67 TaxID=2805435 RepID=UPI002ABD258B|nr:hypothetical protein [Paraburkholderia sp. J67]